MEFCIHNVVPTQSYGQEFSAQQQTQQQPPLMGFTASSRGGYKHSLLEHTTTGPTPTCSSPSSLHSPITNLVSWNTTVAVRIVIMQSHFLFQSMPTTVAGAPFSPHELSPVFQMGVAAATPFSHDQQQKTSSKQPRNNSAL